MQNNYIIFILRQNSSVLQDSEKLGTLFTTWKMKIFVGESKQNLLTQLREIGEQATKCFIYVNHKGNHQGILIPTDDSATSYDNISFEEIILLLKKASNIITGDIESKITFKKFYIKNNVFVF